MAGYRKLGRTSSQRKALLRNQVTNLLYHGKIVTTEAKAKVKTVLRPNSAAINHLPKSIKFSPILRRMFW